MRSDYPRVKTAKRTTPEPVDKRIDNLPHIALYGFRSTQTYANVKVRLLNTLGTFSTARATAALALALTAATAATAALGRSSAHDFAGIIHMAALGSLVVCAAWVAAMIGALMWEHRRGAPSPGRFARVCPQAVRPFLITLCSAGATLGVAGPGTATPAAPAPPTVSLPSLDRPLGGAAQPPGREAIVVRPGDSLWSLVRTRHPSEPTSTTARRVRALYRANVEVIGPDPDLIRPGQVLR